MRSGTADKIAKIFNRIFFFFEQGPVDEVLMDNGTAFLSETLRKMLEKWNTRRYCREATVS